MYEAGITAIVLLLVVGLLGAGLADLTARRIAAEIDRWAADDLLPREQATAVGARLLGVIRSERRRRAAQALSLLGAAVVGLGVILFFAANWSEIPRFVRLGGLLAAMLGLYGAGYWLRELRNPPSGLGDALLFLGTLVFGASLFLVGQMYHVRAHDPLAFLIWSVGAVAVGVLVRSAAHAGLATLTLVAWFVFELLAIERGDFSVYTFLPILLALLGATLYGGATAAKPWLDRLNFSGPIRTLGFVALALGVFVFTFPDAHGVEQAEEALDEPFVAASLWSLVVTTALAGAGLVAIRRWRRTAPWEGLLLALLPALLLVILYRDERAGVSFFGAADSGQVVWLPLLVNLYMAALVVGAILVGHLSSEAWLLNAGILFAGFEIVGRFLDPYWDLLPRSFFFLGGGAAVIALAWLVERRRLGEAPAQ